MRKIIKFITIILILSLFLYINSSFSQGYKIEINFSNMHDTSIMLARHFADKHFIHDTATVDKKGKAEFTGDENLPGGLYSVILPNKSLFDLLLADDQQFSASLDTSDVIKSMKIKGCLENELFYESQKYLVSQREIYKDFQKKLDDKSTPQEEKDQIQESMDQIDKKLSQSWKKIVEEHPETFYATLLEAMNGDEGEFFDNIDFSDERLLNTNIIYTAVRRTMARDLNANKSPSVIIRNSDRLIQKSRANEDVYQYVLTYMLTFYNSFQRIGINNVFVHLAEKYVLSGEAPWFDSTAVEQIRERAEILGGSEVGKKAPEITVQTLEGDSLSLYDLDAKYILLYFWKTGCGHCTDAAKKINELAGIPGLDIEILGIFTKDDKKGWKSFVEEHKMNNWIHAWDRKANTNSNYPLKYYVVSTPIAFLIDENKTIVAKKAGDTGIIDMVDQLIEQKDKFLLH